MVKYNININPDNFIQNGNWDDYLNYINNYNKVLHTGQGEGSDFLGWINLPNKIREKLPALYNSAMELFSSKEAVLCIGIGGSYLGTKAIYSALSPDFSEKKPELLFAGHHLGSYYHKSLLNYLKNKDFGIIVISKSGTTTEPALAFRIFTDLLKKQGKENELNKNIIAITDSEKGALRALSDKLSLKSYVVPDDIGGRYSVFSPVGMVPLSVAGIDIKAIAEGAAEMSELTSFKQLPDRNPAVKYAAFRKLMWNNSKQIEILANSTPELSYVSEWWKQLFGESEGKEEKGIFPSNINLTTDLHSLGQFIQEGNRIIFETFIKSDEPQNQITIPEDEYNFDNLNYLAGKHLDYANNQATEGTIQAHKEGGIPTSIITIQKPDEYNIAQLLYFFEKACGISAYAMNVNPFNQPGVEAYKKNMFKLLKNNI